MTHVKTIVLCILWAFLGKNLAMGSTLTYKTGIIPQAQFPQDGLTDQIYYKIYEAPEYYSRNKVGVIENCLLVHGHGVTNEALQQMVKVSDKPLQRIVRDIIDPADMFIRVTYGEYFINLLSTQACNKVYVLLRESVQTSILEMTLQTERFIKDTICTSKHDPKNAPCAIIGHSKGGAVVTSIVRRCMTERSEIGEAGCKRISSVFSSGGINLGATAAVLAVGAKAAGERLEWSDFLDIGIGTILRRAQGFGFDASGDYTPGKTNPVWVDLSMAAPMDDGLELWTHHYDLLINRMGWWQGKYSAAAGRIVFDSKNAGEQIGYGTLGESSRPGKADTLIQRSVLLGFSKIISTLHVEKMKDYLSVGIEEMKRRFPRMRSEIVWNKLSWDRFQESDGLVEVDSALSICRNSLQYLQDGESIYKCLVFDNINHLAMSGAATEVADAIVETLVR